MANWYKLFRIKIYSISFFLYPFSLRVFHTSFYSQCRFIWGSMLRCYITAYSIIPQFLHNIRSRLQEERVSLRIGDFFLAVLLSRLCIFQVHCLVTSLGNASPLVVRDCDWITHRPCFICSTSWYVVIRREIIWKSFCSRTLTETFILRALLIFACYVNLLFRWKLNPQQERWFLFNTTTRRSALINEFTSVFHSFGGKRCLF